MYAYICRCSVVQQSLWWCWWRWNHLNAKKIYRKKIRKKNRLDERDDKWCCAERAKVPHSKKNFESNSNIERVARISGEIFKNGKWIECAGSKSTKLSQCGSLHFQYLHILSAQHFFRSSCWTLIQLQGFYIHAKKNCVSSSFVTWTKRYSCGIHIQKHLPHFLNPIYVSTQWIPN